MDWFIHSFPALPLSHCPWGCQIDPFIHSLPPHVPTYPQETAARKEKERREANDALTAELKAARAQAEEAAVREGTRECVCVFDSRDGGLSGCVCGGTMVV